MPSLFSGALGAFRGPRARHGSLRLRRLPHAAPLFSAIAMVCSWGSAAAAPVEASASWTRLRFEVIDLDLNDGVAAGYHLGHAYAHSNAGVMQSPGWERNGSGTGTQAKGFLQPVSWGMKLGTGSGSARLDSGGAWTAAQATGRGITKASVSTDSLAYDWGPSSTMGVVLKPNTQLLVSFELVMRVSDAGLLGSDVTQAGATAYIQTYIPVDPDMPSGGGSMEAQSLHTTRDSFAETLERSVTLSSSVSNPLGKELDISLGLNLVSYAGAAPWPDTTPPPVPEPSTYGLMALGLGVLGFCRVRRQAAKTPTERA